MVEVKRTSDDSVERERDENYHFVCLHQVTSRSPTCYTHSVIRPCVHVCLRSFKPLPFFVPPDPTPFAFHVSQMCCALTDVRNIVPAPASAPGTWASV